MHKYKLHKYYFISEYDTNLINNQNKNVKLGDITNRVTDVIDSSVVDSKGKNNLESRSSSSSKNMNDNVKSISNAENEKNVEHKKAEVISS